MPSVTSYKHTIIVNIIVAFVACTIPINIILAGVGDYRAVVTYISMCIRVSILLPRVGY